MYSNGSHDHDLNRKIDKIMASGQPSGDPVLDDLATTVPQANRDFQDRLETDLIARLHAVHDQHRSKNTMNIAIPLPQANSGRRLTFAVPATLAAAMLAVVVMGTIFMGMNRPDGNFTAASQINATTTPMSTVVPPTTSTPVPTVLPIDGPTFQTVVPPLGNTGSVVLPGIENALPIVVARDFIPAGTVLTADMLTFAYYPAESAPEASYTRLEDAIGIMAANFVPRGYPITPGLISSLEGTATPVPFTGDGGNVPFDGHGFTATPVPFTGNNANTLPSFPREGFAILDVPLTSIPDAWAGLDHIQPGVVVDVIAAVNYSELPGDLPLYQRIEPLPGSTTGLSFLNVPNLIVVDKINEIDKQNGFIKLEVAPDQQAVLDYLIEAHVPLYLSVKFFTGIDVPAGLMPTATPMPINIPACQVKLGQNGKLYTVPAQEALWIDGLDTSRTFGLLNVIHDQDANLWYQVQTEDGLVMGWIREADATLSGEDCSDDGLLFPATPVLGADDSGEGTPTPMPTVLPPAAATTTPVQ